MECYDIFKQREVKNKPTTKNTLTRLSFRFDEKIKSYTDKKRLKGFRTTKSAL